MKQQSNKIPSYNDVYFCLIFQFDYVIYNTNVHQLQTETIMQKPSYPINSPFRQKIFDLMKQQETSKILKISNKLQNKNLNPSHSPLKQFSINTQIINDPKISILDTSAGLMHFKTLQEKLGLKNNSHSRSNKNGSKSKSLEKKYIENVSKHKKVSFIEDHSKTCYNPSKSQYKNKNHSIRKKEFSLEKNNSSKNIKNILISKKQSKRKSSLSQSIRNSAKNLKIDQKITQGNNKKHFSSTANFTLDSIQKETQKKNYLLQTLKKMESVRKNLSKTFQQFDKNYTESSVSKNLESMKINKSKQKSKSNLTVISDYINQEKQQNTNHKHKDRFCQQIKQKSKNKQSRSKVQKNQQSSSDIFHRKTPTKRMYLTVSDEISHKIQNETFKSSYPISIQLLRHIRNAVKNPQKWQTILKNDLISLHFRIVKRKLMEIQIHAENILDTLELELDKAHFICQSLKESYSNVKRKQIITLLCSVREIKLSQQINLFKMPKLLINISANMEATDITFCREIQLPYTWIMLIQKINPDKIPQSSSKKSNKLPLTDRIKTRSRLEGIQIHNPSKCPNLLEIFASFKAQNPSTGSIKKEKKKNNQTLKQLNQQSTFLKNKQLQTFSFQLADHEFKLFVKVNGEQNGRKKIQEFKSFDVQLEGKGQNLMNKIVSFLEILK